MSGRHNNAFETVSDQRQESPPYEALLTLRLGRLGAVVLLGCNSLILTIVCIALDLFTRSQAVKHMPLMISACSLAAKPCPTRRLGSGLSWPGFLSCGELIVAIAPYDFFF